MTYSSSRYNDELEIIGFPSKIRLSLDTMETEILFPTEKAPTEFFSPGPLMEVGPGDYLFTARGPKNDQRLINYASSLIRHETGIPRNIIENIAFRFRIGGDFEPMSENKDYIISQLTISRLGRRKIFSALSRTKTSNDDGYYNWELFSIEDENVRQITDIQSHIHDPFISQDGNRAVFLADNTRRQSWDVWVMDLPDGQPRSTRLRETLTQDVKATHRKALESQDQ